MMKNSSYFNEANDAAGNNHTAPTDHGDEKISFACRTLNTFGSKKAKRILPLDFHPNDFTVIVGRGADADRSGNRRLRQLVQSFVQEYQESHDKLGTFFFSQVE